LGSRATARGVEVDAHPVWQWLVAATEQRGALSASFLCARHRAPLHLDALYAGRRALKAGERQEAAAMQRLEGAPDGVWTARAPTRKLLGGGDVGSRTLARARGSRARQRWRRDGRSTCGRAQRFGSPGSRRGRNRKGGSQLAGKMRVPSRGSALSIDMARRRARGAGNGWRGLTTGCWAPRRGLTRGPMALSAGRGCTTR